jgi:hypothetical protein
MLFSAGCEGFDTVSGLGGCIVALLAQPANMMVNKIIQIYSSIFPQVFFAK